MVQDPVCTPDGVVFDIVNIVPYLRKHKVVRAFLAPIARCVADGRGQPER